MKTHTVRTYAYGELSEEAKETALDWWRDGGLDYEWWDCVFADAETIGLKIIGFDLYRQRIDGELTGTTHDTVKAIITNHGKTCDTYKLAQSFYSRRQSGDSYSEEEFTHDLLEEYLISLREEQEYLLSDEAVAETIEGNEYEFTENGEFYC